jgi:hypothetical protein
MPLSSVRRGAIQATLLALAATPVAGQTTYPNVKVSGRLQTQLYYFDNEDYNPISSDLFVRRARIEAKGNITERLSFFIQPSYEGGRSSGVRLRDAWIDLSLTKPGEQTAFILRTGQEKRPFSRYELTSSNNLPSIERGAGDGLVKSQGNNIFEASGFLAHDVGASARVERRLDSGRMLALVAGLYTGSGESKKDANSSKSYGIRATADLVSKLSLGGSYFSHDGIAGADSAYRNNGYGFDAQWSKVGEPGIFALAEYLRGENATDHDLTMSDIQVVAAYNIRMKKPDALLYAIEPSLRFDLADPDTDTGDDGSRLFTAVLGFYFSSRAQWRVAFENQSFEASGASSISGVRTMLAVNF